MDEILGTIFKAHDRFEWEILALLVVLRVTGTINCSWWIALLPLMINIVFIFIGLICLIIQAIKEIKEY